MDKRLNPDIREVDVGTKELRTIKIYPLSFRDQEKTSDIITKAIQAIISGKDKSDVDFIKAIIETVKKNILKVLELVADKEELGKDVLNELTNNQMIEIADAVYEVNYEALGKKVKGLFGTVVQVAELLPGRSLAQSSDDTPSTPLGTSLEPAGEKEE